MLLLSIAFPQKQDLYTCRTPLNKVNKLSFTYSLQTFMNLNPKEKDIAHFKIHDKNKSNISLKAATCKLIRQKLKKLLMPSTNTMTRVVYEIYITQKKACKSLILKKTLGQLNGNKSWHAILNRLCSAPP